MPLLLVLLLVSGCGFQLRGADLSALQSLHLQAQGSPLVRELRNQLSDYDVREVAATKGVATLVVHDERSTRRRVATSAVIEAAQYELRLEVDISLLRDDRPLITDANLFVERLYEVDPGNLSGSHEEQQLLLEEMREQLALQIIRRLEVLLVARNVEATR